MAEQLTLNQWVVGSSPARPTTASEGVTDSTDDEPPKWPGIKPTIRRARGLEMQLSDAIIQYKTCARAEGQSEKTIRETVACVRRFAAFFSGDPILAEIAADDLRGFILALQRREAYAQHPTVKPQHRPLSPATIATYVRGVTTWLAYSCHRTMSARVHCTPGVPLCQDAVLRQNRLLPNRDSCVINWGNNSYDAIRTLDNSILAE